MAEAYLSDREILLLVGENPRRMIAGSLEVSGDLVTWTERCRRRKCTHEGCLQARGVLLSPSKLREWEEA